MVFSFVGCATSFDFEEEGYDTVPAEGITEGVAETTEEIEGNEATELPEDGFVESAEYEVAEFAEVSEAAEEVVSAVNEPSTLIVTESKEEAKATTANEVETESKGSRTGWIILIVIVVLVILAAAYYFFVFKKKEAID